MGFAWHRLFGEELRAAIQKGSRVRVIGTPLRGVVFERKNDVCLVYRDEINKPDRLLYHVAELEIF